MTQSSTSLDTFVSMSSALTGFASDRFAPSVDPVDLKTTYFDYITAKQPDTFPALLSAFDTAAQGGTTPGAAFFDALPVDQANLAKSITKLWYLGSWYNPEDPDNPADQEVVTNEAYIHGLAWQVMQSHAMGNSPFTFGYWASTPAADLALTTGNPDATGGQGAV